VCLLTGILLGIACFFLMRPELYRLGKVDFARSQTREKSWSEHKNDPLDQYIAYKTRDRLLTVSGQAWQDLVSHLDEPGHFTFFKPSDTLFQEIQGRFDNQFTYLVLDQAGQPAYLELTVSQPGDSPPAPASLRYPWRAYSLYTLLAGLIAYFVIPWPKHPPDTAAYGRVRGAWVPDLLIASLLVAVFFALPWLIVPNMADTAHPFVLDGGWIVLTLILCAFALFGVIIYGVDTDYETRSLRVQGSEILIESFKGIQRVPLTDIQEIACGQSEPPKALVRAGLLISLLSWRAAGPTLLMASRQDSVLQVVLKNGQTHRFVLTCLKNWQPVLKALKEAGIPVDKAFDTNQ
jgi:hypothetical protein